MAPHLLGRAAPKNVRTNINWPEVGTVEPRKGTLGVTRLLGNRSGLFDHRLASRGYVLGVPLHVVDEVGANLDRRALGKLTCLLHV